jgi:hypothetical protein
LLHLEAAVVARDGYDVLHFSLLIKDVAKLRIFIVRHRHTTLFLKHLSAQKESTILEQLYENQ